MRSSGYAALKGNDSAISEFVLKGDEVRFSRVLSMRQQPVYIRYTFLNERQSRLFLSKQITETTYGHGV